LPKAKNFSQKPRAPTKRNRSGRAAADKLLFYHRTSAAVAATILREGFRDGTGNYLTDRKWSGVWLASEPLDENEGAFGDTLLEVQVRGTSETLARYEWIEEGKGYREWLIPAAILRPLIIGISLVVEPIER
jgi:hypothetical protein